MEITAKMVKDLRESTGAGMMDCKKALVEASGNIDAAVDILRTRGLAALAKKAGRATNEGVISAWVSADQSFGTLVEVNCETDFVARNADFQAFAAELAQQVAITDPSSTDELLQERHLDGGKTVEQVLGEMVGRIGENISVTRFLRYTLSASSGLITSYIHGVGNIGVLIELSCSSDVAASDPAVAELGRNIAMQIAATAPHAVSREAIDGEVVAHELSIYRAQAQESGKPLDIQEKMALGRLEKFFKEVTLLEQVYVRDDTQTVAQYLESVSKQIDSTLGVVRFTRFVLGESSA